MRVFVALIMLLGSCAASAAPAFDSAGPSVTLPDGSVLPLPPGTHAFGPHGAIMPPAGEPPAAAQRGPRHDGTEPQPPSAAETRKRTLDDLFGRLAQAKDAVESQAIGAMITAQLLHSGSDTADLLMERAGAAMDAKDYATASALLDKIVVLRPRWAEAWNRRATVRYLVDDDVGSMADIGQVLELEPRHFGALSGMGLILHRNGEDKSALTVFRRAQAINPQDPQVKTLIEQIAPDVEGHEL